jgi:hypothetical protein
MHAERGRIGKGEAGGEVDLAFVPAAVSLLPLGPVGCERLAGNGDSDHHALPHAPDNSLTFYLAI